MAVTSIQNHLLNVLHKFFTDVNEESFKFTPDSLWFACNCVRAMKGAIDGCANSMEKVLFLLLKTMNKLAKDHSKQPQLGLLSAKGPPQECLTNSEYGSGAWFIYHAMSGKSAIMLSWFVYLLALICKYFYCSGRSVSPDIIGQS